MKGESVNPTVSLIVSTYNSPDNLRGLYWGSLAKQTLQAAQVMLADNSTDPSSMEQNRQLSIEFGWSRIHTGAHVANSGIAPYDAADLVMGCVTGDWIAFPSDDCYFVPTWLQVMAESGSSSGADVVVCDCLYDRRLNGRSYGILKAAACLGGCDKVSFLVRASVWNGFHAASRSRPNCADGLAVQEIAQNRRVKLVEEVLCVHN